MMNDWHQLKSIIRETVRQVVRAELEKAMAAQRAELLEMLEQVIDRPNSTFQMQVESSAGVSPDHRQEPLAEILSELDHEIEEDQEIDRDSLSINSQPLELEDTIPSLIANTSTAGFIVQDKSLVLTSDSGTTLDLSPIPISPALEQEADLEADVTMEAQEDNPPSLDLPTTWALDDSVEDSESFVLGKLDSSELDLEVFPPDPSLSLFTDRAEVAEIPAITTSSSPIDSVILETVEPIPPLDTEDRELSSIDFNPPSNQTLDINTLEQKRQELLQQLAQLEEQETGLETGLGESIGTSDVDDLSQITGVLEFNPEEDLELSTQIHATEIIPSKAELEFKDLESIEPNADLDADLTSEFSSISDLNLEMDTDPALPVIEDEVPSEVLIQAPEEVLAESYSTEILNTEILNKVPDQILTENPDKNPDKNLDETDRLLNEFADREGQEDQEATPELTYNPRNPWFLGIDCCNKSLSLALTDSLTRRTYTLQFASTNRSHSLPLTDDWQLDQCWDTTIPQALQNNYEQKVQTILAKVVTDLRHPQLPTTDIPLIFENLRGIIVSLPIAQSTAYGVKFRQAILQAGWTTRPESVLVIDRAIAPLLAILEQQRSVTNTFHLSIHCTDEYTTIALSVKPLAFVNLSYGCRFVENTLKEAIGKNIFSHIPEPEMVTYLTNICQAHFQDPSQQKWEYEWQNQQIPVDRSQLEQCQQLALRQWLELVGPHINQFLSQLPDYTPAQIWLMGKLPIGFWDWLSSKLAPARPLILHEKAIVEGLAVAPFWREYLDIVKLQYSDYFLIHEICALRLPDPCSFSTVTDALHQRGVNVKACLDRLQQIITKGIPAQLGLGLDSRGSQLFQANPDGKLSACRDNMLTIRSHLQQLQYGLRQNLAEPLVFPHYP